MESLKVALLQLLPAGSPEGNLQKGLEGCRKAKAMGADIALFPEMWSNGYGTPSFWGLPPLKTGRNRPFLQTAVLPVPSGSWPKSWIWPSL